MDKEQILQRIQGVKTDYPPATRYIRKSERKRKGTQYVLSIPLWRDGQRKSNYIGTFDTLEEAQKARQFTLDAVESFDNVSTNSPDRMKNDRHQQITMK